MESQSVMLANGIQMPKLGFGTWQLSNGQAKELVTTALECGYRSIDTAAAYGNERGVGEALRAGHVPREELFITTKLHDMEGYEHTQRQCAASLDRLGLDYIDLYLIHWPFDVITAETWRALEDLYHDKKVRAIGVSNFGVRRLETLQESARIAPMVNQLELHPRLSQQALREYCQKHHIQIESWSPLMQGKELLENSIIASVAAAHHKTPAQVILRWHIQSGLVAIPKSTSPERIAQNLAIFDFSLTTHEMQQIDELNQDQRANPIADPETFDFSREIYERLQHIND